MLKGQFKRQGQIDRWTLVIGADIGKEFNALVLMDSQGHVLKTLKLVYNDCNGYKRMMQEINQVKRIETESGHIYGRKHISKEGRFLLRATLYRMAVSLINHHPNFRSYYRRKLKGGRGRPSLKKKEALCAVAIKLVIGCQGQWRAGRKDPQAPGPLENKGQTTAQSNRATKIDYSHRGVGPYGPEATFQLPSSDNYLYVDPEYPEVYPA